MQGFTESEVEEAALAWLAAIGWSIAHGPDIAPETPGAERATYCDVVLEGRLRDALARLNPALPDEAKKDAFRKLTRPEGATLEVRNRSLHRMLVNGVTVEYRDLDGAIRGAQARAVDFEEVENNDWLAVKPVHRRREQARTPSRRRVVRERPAARRARTQESRG